MRGTACDVRIFPDLGELGHAAAEMIVSLLSDADQNRQMAIVLSGGSTPAPLYSLLGSPAYRNAVPWDRIHLFWSDERCVPPDHRDSNYKMAMETLISRISVPSGQVHRIPGENGPVKAAEFYERELERCFAGELPRFNLMLLGVGKDGHTASLFPGSPSLEEKHRLALPVYLDPSSHDRVTLTLPVLNNAEHVIFLTSGEEKSVIVSEIIEQGNRKRHPAGMVQPVRGTLTWMMDQKASAALARPGAKC